MQRSAWGKPTAWTQQRRTRAGAATSKPRDPAGGADRTIPAGPRARPDSGSRAMPEALAEAGNLPSLGARLRLGSSPPPPRTCAPLACNAPQQRLGLGSKLQNRSNSTCWGGRGSNASPASLSWAPEWPSGTLLPPRRAPPSAFSITHLPFPSSSLLLLTEIYVQKKLPVTTLDGKIRITSL